ncbi:hypothetical protein, partial [Nocardia nova]|uniref:hypothetical protein n=1 Tax=Nocardia nova TaxID=37330 RepID=UPI0025B12070
IAAKGYPDGSARIAVGDPRADAAVLHAFGGRAEPVPRPRPSPVHAAGDRCADLPVRVGRKIF